MPHCCRGSQGPVTLPCSPPLSQLPAVCSSAGGGFLGPGYAVSLGSVPPPAYTLTSAALALNRGVWPCMGWAATQLNRNPNPSLTDCLPSAQNIHGCLAATALGSTDLEDSADASWGGSGRRRVGCTGGPRLRGRWDVLEPLSASYAMFPQEPSLFCFTKPQSHGPGKDLSSYIYL